MVGSRDKTIMAHPTADKAPAAISKMVITVTISGTSPANGLLAKWPFNHSRVPFLSTILSMPDFRNKIARKAETKIRIKKIAPSVVCRFGIWQGASIILSTAQDRQEIRADRLAILFYRPCRKFFVSQAIASSEMAGAR